MNTTVRDRQKATSEINFEAKLSDELNWMHSKSDPNDLPQPGLAVPCAVEFLERLSFYGLRAILVLYMIAPVVRGGLEFSDAQATAIYGL